MDQLVAGFLLFIIYVNVWMILPDMIKEKLEAKTKQ
jgi:hypothetical protein